MRATVALRLAVAHWTWLANNPMRIKGAYVHSRNWVCSCALCDLDGEYTNGCDNCPMLGHWPSIKGLVSKCTQGVFKHWGIGTERYGDNVHCNGLSTYDDVFLCWVMVEAFEERLHALRQGE